jgi:cellulose synthase/poly-beta-1,6-N-acetylglucosamine synthase-like glycosyltransferase
LAFEPSGKTASNIDAGDVRGVPGTSLPSPARRHAGFAEQSALFRPVDDLPVELRALRGHFDAAFLRFAAARAEALNIEADVIVSRSGKIPPDAMLGAYAADLGVEIDFLESADETIDALEVLSSGMLPSPAGDHGPTIALLPGTIRTIYQRATSDNPEAKRFRITSAERLRAFVERSASDLLAKETAFGLRDRTPEFSAASTRFAEHRIAILTVLAMAAAAFYFAPGPTRLAAQVVLAAIFLTWAMLRLFACASPGGSPERREISERELPLYSILLPLHREARTAPELVEAISALNYPREKLEVKLILEPDDEATRAAVDAVKLDPCFEVIIAPASGPRTKPKALRAAMPFVRGEFLVIYDAEDRPHPNQLRDAYAEFLEGDENLACVQAKLAIDNVYPSFLAENFRAEYSGLFDVLLPTIARLRLPLPLGGTSNHFKTSVLREVGLWDPHNVTEDADLGVRLARFGYTTGVVDSTTWEEAPSRLGAWLPQRSRWFKGWMQTYLVHMRSPLLLLRQLGWRGFVAFQLLIGGSVLAALVHPVFALLLVSDAALGSLLVPADSFAQWADKSLVFVTLMSGYVASGLLALVGMRRRGLLSSAWVLLFIPIYWLLLSAAAWRAVWHLLTAPHQWEKTAHGVVRRRNMNST